MLRTKWLAAAIAAGWIGAASAQGGAGGGTGGAGAGGAGTGTGAGGGAPESQARANASQQGTTSSGDAASTLPKLHAGNAAEIQAGTWMQQHATNAKVKDFAKKMVKDHTAMDKDVQAYAKKHDVALTGDASVDSAKAEQQKALDELKGMQGAQADRHYMQMMVEDHTKDVSEVKVAAQQAKQGSDKDYSKLLDKSEKKMEGHLKDAQKISRDLAQRQARAPSQ